ncbi:dihydroneopterin aldolase [Parvularcula sp. ZS-1/3]|uniref:Dihydroneopterin aldolase n=1 Tax=Parvularcula mediterranea TaxID=2732508 RepID=A0A7Y3RJN5_9PROT|nr:dihydroneopterin aldolase [Parvularcula mediterranea]NNU15303.1 dihydroneopterin aldolase [Parvularcula mediterranea]
MELPLLAPGYYAVFLEDLRKHVKLGVLEHEVRPQAVSFNLAVIASRVGKGDGIEDVVDYDNLRQTILEVTADEHFGLQETLCEAIIASLRTRDNIHGVLIETRKLTVYDDAEAVGCRMSDIDKEAIL